MEILCITPFGDPRDLDWVLLPFFVPFQKVGVATVDEPRLRRNQSLVVAKPLY